MPGRAILSGEVSICTSPDVEDAVATETGAGAGVTDTCIGTGADTGSETGTETDSATEAGTDSATDSATGVGRATMDAFMLVGIATYSVGLADETDP